MKKSKILMVLMLFILMMPFIAKAEEVTTTSMNTPVNVYFFHGDGCPHCAEAEEWFESIKGEYGSYFNVVAYEVWNNADNQELMENVANYLNEKVGGVPFIIVGGKTFNGFNQEIGTEILDAIKSEYELDVSKRTDVMVSYNANKEEDNKNSEQIVITIVALVIASLVVVFLVFARRGIDSPVASDNVVISKKALEVEEDVKNKKDEEKVQAVESVEEEKNNKKISKKSNNKGNNSKKKNNRK